MSILPVSRNVICHITCYGSRSARLSHKGKQTVRNTELRLDLGLQSTAKLWTILSVMWTEQKSLYEFWRFIIGSELVCFSLPIRAQLSPFSCVYIAPSIVYNSTTISPIWSGITLDFWSDIHTHATNVDTTGQCKGGLLRLRAFFKPAKWDKVEDDDLHFITFGSEDSGGGMYEGLYQTWTFPDYVGISQSPDIFCLPIHTFEFGGQESRTFGLILEQAGKNERIFKRVG